MTAIRSSLARWLPAMRTGEAPPPLTRPERQQLARMLDRLGWIAIPKEDLRNVELDALTVVQRRYLEVRT